MSEISPQLAELLPSDTVTLDWDIEFSTVDDSVSMGVLRRFVNGNKEKIINIEKRRSAHGNTHVRIRFKETLTFFETLQLRAFLRDDVYRIKMDLLRLAIAQQKFESEKEKGKEPPVEWT